jgi:hypothetical protein
MTDQPPPANATEARAVLDARIADKGFADRVFAGDIAAKKELDALHAKIHAGGDDVVVEAMTGKLPEGATSDQRLMAETAAWMREKGFPERAIQETLSDKKPTPEDVERARLWKTMAMKNEDFVKRYLAGDGAARLEMDAADVVLTIGARAKAFKDAAGAAA